MKLHSKIMELFYHNQYKCINSFFLGKYKKIDTYRADFFVIMLFAVCYSRSPALRRQIIWVMVPMGQKAHQVRGLNNAMTTSPMMVEVSIIL